jgi:Etoposide-induced protein 2.4 (EI24)
MAIDPSSARALNPIFDAAGRAAGYCLHPRVIGWSLAPLLLAAMGVFGAMWLAWEPMVAGMRAFIDEWRLVDALLRWLDAHQAEGWRTVVANGLVMALLLPAVMAVALLLVAALMTPAMARLVAERRFPGLERRQGGGFLAGVLGSLGATLVALAGLVLSLPLWFIPGVVLVLPPLIWGWLSYRVFSFDVLAQHADGEEREYLRHTHRLPLLVIGVVCGFLGAAPSLLFAFGAMSLVFAPLLLPLAVFLYILVFAYSALWFTHYLLAALQAKRSARPPVKS